MIKEKAYAKINLFLNVVSKRIDGFHDLDMAMAPLKYHDTLMFKKTDSSEITITTDKLIVENIEENIVFKVASYLKEQFSIDKGVNIHIEKKIPIGGGLGGGSADAAATFRGLNRLWDLNMSLEDMAELSLDFGSDIPFCIYNKLAIAQGKGEKLSFIKSKPKFHVLLVNPNIQVSTSEVFKRVKEENISKKSVKYMEEALNNHDYSKISQGLYNSLESISFEIEPKIKELKNTIIDLGLANTIMSGSGATVFTISQNKKKLKEVQKVLSDNFSTMLTKLL